MPAVFLMFSLKELSSIGAKINYRSSPLAVPFGCSLNIFLSLTHGFVYVFGSSNLTVSSKLSRFRRCQRSCTRKSSLNGLPQPSSHSRESNPAVSTTNVSPSHLPVEYPYQNGPVSW